MFENLTDRFDRAFKVLKGHGQITEINVAETIKEIRRALLDDQKKTLVDEFDFLDFSFWFHSCEVTAAARFGQNI